MVLLFFCQGTSDIITCGGDVSSLNSSIIGEDLNFCYQEAIKRN